MSLLSHRAGAALFTVAGALLMSGSAFTQSAATPRPDAGASAVRKWREANEEAIVRELSALASLPNHASDLPNIRRNAELLKTMLERRGVTARLLDDGNWPPAVYGELRVPGATRTVMWYAHYDGQPVVASEWATPPFAPTLRARPNADGSLGAVKQGATNGRYDPEDRLYARAVADDRAPIIAMLAALDAMKATGQAPSVNIKFFLDGEEEANSANVPVILQKHKELLKADLWLFCDGPAHQSRQIQLVFGVRGVMGMEATVYGPSRALHSGHYGNWAPNPGMLLNEMIASMRDADGKILVDNYMREFVPLTPTEIAAARSLPPVDADLRRSLLLGATEANNASLTERIMLPAINLRGMRVGQVGALANNAVPTEAQASFDFRLVPNLTPEKVKALVEAHLRKRGWFVTHAAPTPEQRLANAKVVRLEWGEGYPAYRTSPDLPVSLALRRTITGTIGRETLVLPTLGGSIPMQQFYEALQVPLINFPIVNHDNAQHAKDENIRLQNLWDGIELFAGVMVKLGREWRSPTP
jgi:acetylornithine deacetylase/succinyl-diaminopimelate desuccinylase-like protein